MTATDTLMAIRPFHRRSNLCLALQAAWHTYSTVRHQQKVLKSLAHLPSRLIIDVGLNPEDISDAIDACDYRAPVKGRLYAGFWR